MLYVSKDHTLRHDAVGRRLGLSKRPSVEMSQSGCRVRVTKKKQRKPYKHLKSLFCRVRSIIPFRRAANHRPSPQLRGIALIEMLLEARYRRPTRRPKRPLTRWSRRQLPFSIGTTSQAASSSSPSTLSQTVCLSPAHPVLVGQMLGVSQWCVSPAPSFWLAMFTRVENVRKWPEIS